MNIPIFSITKNDIFFKGIEEHFEQDGIIFSGMSTNPDTFIAQILQCKIKPLVLLISANWAFNIHQTTAEKIIQKCVLELPHDYTLLLKYIYVTNSYEPLIVKELCADKYPDGYLFQNSSQAQMIECIKKVHSGERFIMQPNKKIETTKY